MLLTVKFYTPRSPEGFELTIAEIGPEAIALNLLVQITCKGWAGVAVPIALIADALYYGLENTVMMYKRLMRK